MWENFCWYSKSVHLKRLQPDSFHRYSLLSLSSTQGWVLNKGPTNSTLYHLHSWTFRHVHRHFGGQVLKPKIKGTHRQNYLWKGHFSHPGQKGRCLSTTRGLSVHVPVDFHTQFRCPDREAPDPTHLRITSVARRKVRYACFHGCASRMGDARRGT